MFDMKRLSLSEKPIIKGVKAPVGDFRDWEAITSWPAPIADVLKKDGP